MGRDRNRKGHDTSRDSGPFIALPCAVLDCPAYLSLSHPAKSLLLEIARQCIRDNNGRLLASRTYLAKRGWKSADTITRAIRELIAARLIHQTVMGHFPKTASWYAVTWRALDRLPGFDAGAADSFERGAYTKQPLKNARLRPSDGQERGRIGPPAGGWDQVVGPQAGPMKGIFAASPRPSNGHHLDKPSAAPHFRQTIDTDSPTLTASVTPRASNLMPTLQRELNDDVVIFSEPGAGMTFEQLITATDPKADTGSSVAKAQPNHEQSPVIFDKVGDD